MSVFTVASRDRLRDTLVAAARADDDVTAAALVGSGATGTEDRWSDVDLALRLAEGADRKSVADRWTEALYAEHDAAHHVEVEADGALFRAFLLADSLQVDVSFWPADRFRATQPGFRLLFGAANEPTAPRGPDPERLAALGWLHALHVRSALSRGRWWQAAIMLDGVRDHVVALACLRHGLPPHQGRGVDGLPDAELRALAESRAHGIEHDELVRSHGALLELLSDEISRHDGELARRLATPMRLLAEMEST